MIEHSEGKDNSYDAVPDHHRISASQQNVYNNTEAANNSAASPDEAAASGAQHERETDVVKLFTELWA